MAVKMKDIAEALGVSLVTVSKALRHHPDISTQTRERVEAKVKELNYRPNLTARSLVTGRSSLIGLIVPDLLHPFFAEVARSLSLTLRAQGYFLIIASSEEDPTLEQQEIEHMLAHRLDALIVATCQPEPSMLQRTQAGDVPLILIDRYLDGFTSHYIGTDDYLAGKLAAEHLIAIGCKRIAHIRNAENSTGRRRYQGFVDTLAAHKRPLAPDYLIAARSADVDGTRHGANALQQLAALKQPPDGIFCYNDVVAIGAVLQAAAQGIRIPQDIAILGCGNLHYDEAISPPLSSIDQRSQEIGTHAATLVLDLIKPNAAQDHKQVVLEPRLIPRASTARAAAPKPPKKSAAK